MSDYAFLVSNSSPLTASIDDHGNRTYANADVVRDGGKYIFPLLWLTAFRAGDVVQRVIQGDVCSCLMTTREQALRQLGEVQEMICREFANVAPHWAAWEKLVRDTKGSHLKIDASDLWGMDPDLFESGLRDALAWLASGDRPERDGFLEFCGLRYDEDSKTLALGMDPVTEGNLLGVRLT